MPFEDVIVVDPYVEKGWTPRLELTVASTAEVDALEARLQTKLPVGYREFVTVLGFGSYCNFIRIDMPKVIADGYEEYQRFLDEFWFWDGSEDLLSKSRGVESIKIGDTVDGDVIVFHPTDPGELFVLPRNDDLLYVIGVDLFSAIDWLCTSHQNPTGSVGENHEKRYFVPNNPLAYEHGVLWPEGF